MINKHIHINIAPMGSRTSVIAEDLEGFWGGDFLCIWLQPLRIFSMEGACAMESEQRGISLKGLLPGAGSIRGDTLILTIVSLVLQGLSLLLNILVSRRLGEAAVGVMSLVISFYVFALTFSNGNIFTSTSRFVSEEIGKGKVSGCKRSSPEGILFYALIFGGSLSTIGMFSLWIGAKPLAEAFLKSPEAYTAIRLLGLSLPLATVGSCIKGYFHAKRNIRKPCWADILESIVKFVTLAGIILAVKSGGDLTSHTLLLLNAVAISMVAGETVSCIYLSASYVLSKPISHKCSEDRPSIPSLWRYFLAILPIIISGYTFTLLSSANEALVPIMLKLSSGSTQVALEQYGAFEGIVLPVIFFPSVLLQSLSLILMPEFARIKAAGNSKRVSELAGKVLKDGLWVSLFAAMLLFSLGEAIGSLACPDDPLPGKTLKILCAVVPFIYMEILMEGMLRGLGKQNFCTLNSAAEYIIRILSLVIFTPILGFGGVLVSYFASNVTCNIARLIMLAKTTKFRFDWMGFFGLPLLSALTAGSVATLVLRFLSQGQVQWPKILEIGWFLIISGAIYILSRSLWFKPAKNGVRGKA